MDDVRIVRDPKGVYDIRASGTVDVSKSDIMAVHMDPDGARFFRDIGKYDRCSVGTDGVMEAEWKVDSKRIVLIKSPRLDEKEGIDFWTGEGSDIHMEGTWTFEADEQRPSQATKVGLSQRMGLNVPPFVPGFIVRRILRQKIRRAFEDMSLSLSLSFDAAK